MREKGLIVAKKKDEEGESARQRAGSGQQSLLQRGGETMHLPGEATNPDEQTYQFVTQKNLRMAQDTVRKITSNV